MAVETLKIVLTADNKQALLAMRETVTSLNGVSVAGAKAGGAAGKMGKDFTGLSRVIQDLPYGFNGIANNLTQLLPAAGAAGLAFSGIVTALTFAQVGFGAWTRGMGDSKKATEDATKANEEYRQTLAKEMSQLDILFATATNDNISRKARLEAVKQLRDNYGGYLQGLTDEEILLGKGAAAQLKLRDALIETAKARALSDAIQKDYDALIKLDEDLAKQKKESIGADLEMQAKSKGIYKENLAEKKKYAEEEKRVETERFRVNAEIQRKLAMISDKAVDPFKIDDGKKDKSAEDAKKRATFLASMHGKMLEESMRQDAFTLKAPEEKIQKPEKAPELLSTLAVMEAKKRLKTVEDDRNKTLEIANNLTNTAMTGITTLVNAMMQGQNVGQALGDMFKKMAIDIALAAAKAAIFQGILALLPGATTGAALAKGGTGGFFKMFKGLLGFSQGGTVSGPQSGYPVMLHGTEHIVRPDQMKSIIASAAQMGGGGASRVVVEGTIRGNDIFLSQQRTGTFRSLTT
jgi:hypothetical protein